MQANFDVSAYGNYLECIVHIKAFTSSSRNIFYVADSS